ncbi:hypothetical protein GOODEAATRI_005886 [Goodea atripinnis]|uniref:Uncharacterized protein n=1 Tax=Goodea atripinnis TaxID=208336 RepID=A0ABV0MYZ9_9TELE
MLEVDQRVKLQFELNDTLQTFAIQQKKSEAPREYYRCLRAAYFQGRNAPGTEEEQAFKSLFLHNLHENVRYDVTMYCRTKTLSMQEICKYAQMAWETLARPIKGSEGEARVLQIQTERNSFALEDQEMSSAGTHGKRGLSSSVVLDRAGQAVGELNTL